MILNGKVAIISGAGKGLGRASAIAMAKEGAKVVLLARTRSDLENVAHEIQANGGKGLPVPTDISSLKEVRGAVRKTLEAFDSIDIIMNNAAVSGPIGPMHGATSEEWVQALQVNLVGVFLLAREALPEMISKKHGKIINVTSGLGQMVMPGLGAYSVAKAGVIHLTRIMAEELRPYNIQVNGLDPGVMDTPLQTWIREQGVQLLPRDISRQFVELKEKGLLKAPEKVAKLAVFLASSASDHLTGHVGTESYFSRFGYD
ncbi:MAG: SDR family NAD(P)-dependent oxidoreductase [Deltaproteobacteria bacterium]|nr:MAG: SDR family NAD(P)-dependent oxidoreductase [Deltaproteobacteria bacterium]